MSKDQGVRGLVLALCTEARAGNHDSKNMLIALLFLEHLRRINADGKEGNETEWLSLLLLSRGEDGGGGRSRAAAGF